MAKFSSLKEKYTNFFINNGAVAVGEDDEGLVVFVTKKPSKALVSFSVVNVKYIELKEPFTAYNRQGKVRPLKGGISIGHKNIGAGTLSVIVKDRETKAPLILSNNHVLADTNRGKKGDLIFQPGIADAVELGISAEQVGTLDRFVPLIDGATVDAAVANLTVQDWETGIYNIYPEIRDFVEPAVNMPVQKSGRTSDTTYGTVVAINADVDVNYSGKNIKLRDCFIAKLGGAPGDSGSLITTTGSHKKAVGLLFAGSSGYVVGCKWSNVSEQLKVDLMEDIRPVVLDISHHNGKILDVDKMKRNKVLAVFLKCSEGNYFKDPKFDENWEILKQAKIKVAPYIFINPRVSAQDHFSFFKRCIGDKVPDLPVMLDCESTGDQSIETITAVIQTLAKLIDSWQDSYTKLKPIIYTRASWWNAYVLPWSGWSDYGLWVARYETDLPWFGASDRFKVRDWSDWLLWQYSADGNRQGNRYGVESTSIDKNIASENFIKVYLNNAPSPEIPDEYPHYGKVLVDHLRIRSAANITASVVGYLKRGERIGILGFIQSGNNRWAKLSNNRYCAVIYNGTRYIEVEGETLPSGKKGRVLVNGLRVRNRPNIGASVVGYLYVGNEVDILEEIDFQNQKWIKIGLDKYCAMVYNGNVYVQII